jgi:hypothetical protein
MRRLAAIALILGCFHLTASTACALGADHGKGGLAKGELVKGQAPVHGYWVNEVDVFFYAGDTKAFNKFAASYGQLKKVSLKVVIHPGIQKARSPWDKADRNIPVTWRYYVSARDGTPGKPAPTQVDVWLGSQIDLQELRIPANVEVVSGGEIEKFVADRKKQ